MIAYTDGTESGLTKSVPFYAYDPSDTFPFVRPSGAIPDDDTVVTEVTLAKTSKVVEGISPHLVNEDDAGSAETVLRRCHRSNVKSSPASH